MQETVLSPPRPSLVLQPGLRTFAPGMERYRVRGGGSVVVRVAPGDKVSLRDLEGCQRWGQPSPDRQTASR